MVAADGGIFGFGDAAFFGSVPGVLGPGIVLNGSIIGMVGSDDGYLNVGLDGGIFAFGSTPFHGSLGANPPAVGVATVMVLPDGGYVMVDRNGVAYGFGSGASFVSAHG